MIKKYITYDECYPVFDLRDPENREVESPRCIELTEEQFKDYQRVEREYENWQETLRKATKYKRSW